MVRSSVCSAYCSALLAGTHALVADIVIGHGSGPLPHCGRLHICCIAKGLKEGQQPHTLFVWPHFTSNHITGKAHHDPFNCCLCLLGCCLLLPQGPRSVL